jgi:uncharacterized protein Yka (UPF0111/DUF47 family)
MAKMGRPIALPGPLGDLARKLGGVDRLAEEVGVCPRTIRRWAHGVLILPMPRKMLTMLFEKHDENPNGMLAPAGKG